MILRMQSHAAQSPASFARRLLGKATRQLRDVAGVIALWTLVFGLGLLAWLPAMHSRTHQLSHQFGQATDSAQPCDAAHASCHHAASNHQSASPSENTPTPTHKNCDICSQLMLALLYGAVPSIDPPLPTAVLAERVEIGRERTSARELAHLPPARGPPSI